MLLLIASCAVVSASEQGTVVYDTGNHIEPVNSTAFSPMSVQMISSSVTQGMMNRHAKEVSSYITSLNVDLNWGNSANSLRLKIYSPDGSTFGPYYDSFDGVTDGRINLNVINHAGVPQGTWYYEVYGERVTGRQAYTI